MTPTLNRRAAIGLVAYALLTASAPAPADVTPLDAGATLFVDVNVVSMAAPGVQMGTSVLVRDGRIEAIGPRADLPTLEGVRTVDGGGTAYLIPGLADMHLHIPPNPGEQGDPTWRTATLLIANGVTTARGLAGHPGHIAIRDRIHRGDLLGPTLYIAGPAMHIGAVKSVEDAKAKIGEQQQAGFDLVKSHHIPVPAIYDAVQEAAREAKLPVSGHVANEVGLDRAIAANQQIEHLDGFVAALMGDAAADVQFGQFPPPFLLEEEVADECLADLAGRMAKDGIWNTPTLALFARVADIQTPTDQLRALPEMRFIADGALDAWSQQRAGMINSGHFDAAYAGRFTGLRNRIVRALREAGAPMLAGSDCPQAFLAPGFALHDELRAMVAAGLSPWEAMQTATANPARYLKGLPREGSATGVAADFGTIEVGKRADLVLLDADPTASIDNAGKIRGVMVRGRWLDRGTLDGLLEEVAASVGKAG